MQAIVTVVGRDQVGIIAAVCVELANYNVNVLDISQTVMEGYFTMMMVVDVSGCTVPLGLEISYPKIMLWLMVSTFSHPALTI